MTKFIGRVWNANQEIVAVRKFDSHDEAIAWGRAEAKRRGYEGNWLALKDGTFSNTIADAIIKNREELDTTGCSS